MPNNCLSDCGYEAGEALRSAAVADAALIRQIGAAAIAIDNANRLISNYGDQRDIAQRSIDIAEAQQNQLSTVFWPREEQFLAEFSTPEPVETVEAMGARYAGRLVASVAGAFAGQLKEARCSARRFCTSANKKVFQDLMLARSVAMANARVLGRNIAFAEYQARHDINLSRRMQAVALGRGLIDQAMSLYQAAGRGFAAAGEVLSSQLSSSIEAFGYHRQVRANALAAPASTLYGGRTSYDASMPGTVGSGWNGEPLPGAVPFSAGTSFGYQSGMQGLYDLSASETMEGDTTGLSGRNPSNVFSHLQAEKGMNEGYVGNRDLARTGIRTFPVIGASGGTVVINMDSFPLAWVDHKAEGETGS